jgi:hypothetical protein
MSHDDFLLKPIRTDLIKSNLNSIYHFREVLAPLDIGLLLGGIGKVDEEQSLVS